MTSARIVCTLCGLTTLYPLQGDDGDAYCCPACVEVAGLLKAPAESAPKSDGKVGPQVSTELTLSLNGLWCSSCAWLIQERLGRSAGVVHSEVSFLRREVRLSYLPDETTPNRLKRAIRMLGYGARLPGERPYDEEEAFFDRLLIGGVLAMHIMVISFMIYIRQWLGLDTPESQWLVEIFHLMVFAAALPIMAILGLPILRAGLAGLLRGRPTTHTLVAIGAFAAFAVSVRNLMAGDGRVYFDTAAMLFFLLAIGRWLELQAHKASNEAVERLVEKIPQTARWLSPDGEKNVGLDELPPGARVQVLPGERFPVDGVVAEGEGDVDESLLTGEPTPQPRRAGDSVLAGTINLDGAFEVITSAVGESSTAGQITRMLHQALWQRAPVERLADRLAAWLVPLAVVLAGITFVYWTAARGVETGILNALSVLLIACPCALGLATPLTLWRALIRASQSGVILRSTAVIERLAKIRRVYFDKTGTLTQLPMQLVKVGLAGGEEASVDPDSPVWHRDGDRFREFAIYAASLEALSEHPFARALSDWARTARLELAPTDGFRALPGAGVEGSVGAVKVWVGSKRLMGANGLQLPGDLADLAEAWQGQGLAVVYAGWMAETRGIFGFGETMRPESPEAIHSLQSAGIRSGVLTGDDTAAARRWERKLGIPVQGGMLPEEKLGLLQSGGESVAMVGDGINDGPALAAAPVGIAMNQGTDVARAAAEVVLVRDDLRAIPWLLGLGRESLRRVRQNLAWALVYNLLGITLAMSGHLQPVLAALAMVLSSLIVTANALRLGRYPGPAVETDPPGFRIARQIYSPAFEELT